jgi:hypothetical protein
MLEKLDRKRVYLPLNRIQPPTWASNSPVFADTPLTRLFLKDIDGHPRAVELLAETPAEFREDEPNITEFANTIFEGLRDR